MVPVRHVKREDVPFVYKIAKVALLYARSTLNVVPIAADSVAKLPVPDAGDTADERRVLNANPRTPIVLRVPVLVPTVSSSTVLYVPALESDHERFEGVCPNAERT